MKHLFRGALALVMALACTVAPLAAQSDPFSGYQDKVDAPATHWVAITPSDSTDLTRVPKGLYVGTGGNIAMIGALAPSGATGVTWSNVPAGSILPARPRRVLATGTTASGLVALY